MLYPLSYGSLQNLPAANLSMDLLAADKSALKNKEAAQKTGGLALSCGLVDCKLRSARDFGSLGVDAPAVESIVDNFSDCGNIRIHIHPITGREMTNYSLGSNFQYGTGQLRKTPCLNMVDSLKPLSQRQALVKIHDSIFLL